MNQKREINTSKTKGKREVNIGNGNRSLRIDEKSGIGKAFHFSRRR